MIARRSMPGRSTQTPAVMAGYAMYVDLFNRESRSFKFDSPDEAEEQFGAFRREQARQKETTTAQASP